MKWILAFFSVVFVALFWHAILVGVGIAVILGGIGALTANADRGRRAADLLDLR